MSGWQWCGLALVLLAGCRNLDNAQVDVLERELRQQEDYIYELEDYLVSYSEKLRQARLAQCETKSTTTTSGSSKTKEPLPEPTLDVDPAERVPLPLNGRNKLAPTATTDVPSPADAETPATSEAPPADSPEVPAEPEAVNPEEMEAPALEIGPGVGAAEPLLIPDPIDYQADAEVQVAAQAPTQATADSTGEPALVAPQVTAPRLAAERLEIRRVFAEPAEDGASTESLLVVVEALNATDEPVDAIGAASVMVMMRDAPDSLKRIERWDFTAEETAAAWQSSHLGDGLHLELPLSKAALPEGELELWARVVNEEGVKLLTPPDQAYRFEANQLASMADAAENTALASNDGDPSESATAEPLPAPVAAPAAETIAEATPAAQWRTSPSQAASTRVTATSAASSKGGGWTSRPIGLQEPRVATAPAASPGRPSWKRSATAQASKEAGADWTPFR